MQALDTLRARPQGALRQSDGSVLWRVWAPKHRGVRLVMWPSGQRTGMTMQPEGDGYFIHTEANAHDALRYAYRVADGDLDLPDPASRWQPEGVHRPSAVFSPQSFTWTDRAWRGLDSKTLVIYELHVGTFSPEGTFRGVIPRLSQLADLGVTAIEVMPVAQFPGARNWGYDGVHPYAAQNSYGGPHQLRELVDAAHSAGIGVILDVVYNHWGPEGNYLGQFGPYYTDRYHTPWGTAINYDAPESDPIRRFVIDNACYWVRDLHIDGLRLDAVQTIFDHSALSIVAEIQQAVQEVAREVRRSVIVTLETDENDSRYTAPAERGGYDVGGVWADDFHHALHALLTGERDGYYADFGAPEQLVKALNTPFVYDGCYSSFRRRRHGNSAAGLARERFIVCTQNHDQVGNRPRGDRLSTILSPEAQRFAAALLLLSPGTPLLFMGEEYAETSPFPFFCSFLDPQLSDAVRTGRRREFAEMAFKWGDDLPDACAEATFNSARLKWSWPEGSHQAGMRQLYRELLHARRKWPPLVDREHTRARLGSAGEPSLVLERGSGTPLIAWANLTGESRPITTARPPSRLLLSTAEARFGGPVDHRTQIEELLPYEVAIWGEARWLEGSA
jgi:maltooligosyltrehalose trehalohydrolase